MTTTATRSSTTTILDVRCSYPTCGMSGQGKLLFRISVDRQTIYAKCPRGHEQVIRLADLSTDYA